MLKSWSSMARGSSTASCFSLYTRHSVWFSFTYMTSRCMSLAPSPAPRRARNNPAWVIKKNIFFLLKTVIRLKHTVPRESRSKE